MHIHQQSLRLAFILISLSGLLRLLPRLLWGQFFGSCVSLFFICSTFCFYAGWFFLAQAYMASQPKTASRKKLKKIPAQTTPLSKLFLNAMVFFLSFTALVSITLLLSGGSFGQLETRILLSTSAIGLYSLLGLAYSASYTRLQQPLLLRLGLIFAGIGLGSLLAVIWFELFEFFGRTALLFFIWNIGFVHGLLLFGLDLTQPLPLMIRKVTCVFICLVAFMLSLLIIQDNLFYRADFFYRLLGVFSILDGLGTILAPLLEKTSRS